MLGAERGGEPMTLEADILEIMHQRIGQLLTVEEVVQEVAERLTEQIRSVLNGLAASGHLQCDQGGEGQVARYGFHVERRT
jgi:hypothetical protein